MVKDHFLGLQELWIVFISSSLTKLEKECKMPCLTPDDMRIRIIYKIIINLFGLLANCFSKYNLISVCCSIRAFL